MMFLKLVTLLYRVFLLIFFTTFFFASAFCQNLTNSEIISKIEQSLVFDDETKNQINFYRNDRSKKESNFSINNSAPLGNKLDIIVVESKIDNLSIRQKEKLAYNASLIDQHEVAIELYKDVLKQEPENNYVKLALATSYQKLQQFTQAKKYYYELLETETQNKELIIANLLAIMSQESPRESIYLISKLARQNPKSSFILASAAMAYDRVGEYQNAISMLERAVLNDESRVDYKYNLAIIYDKNKDYEKALSLYKKIIKSNYSEYQIPILQIKERIDFIKDNHEY